MFLVQADPLHTLGSIHDKTWAFCQYMQFQISWKGWALAGGGLPKLYVSTDMWPFSKGLWDCGRFCNKKCSVSFVCLHSRKPCLFNGCSSLGVKSDLGSSTKRLSKRLSRSFHSPEVEKVGSRLLWCYPKMKVGAFLACHLHCTWSDACLYGRSLPAVSQTA